MKAHNALISLLELLKVKHTQEFSDWYLNEHSHKYNLLGFPKCCWTISCRRIIKLRICAISPTSSLRGAPVKRHCELRGTKQEAIQKL